MKISSWSGGKAGVFDLLKIFFFLSKKPNILTCSRVFCGCCLFCLFTLFVLALSGAEVYLYGSEECQVHGSSTTCRCFQEPEIGREGGTG